MTALGGSAVSFRICCWLGVPGQQFVNAVDLVVGDTFEDLGELGLWVDVVEPGGLDERVNDGGGLAATGRARSASWRVRPGCCRSPRSRARYRAAGASFGSAHGGLPPAAGFWQRSSAAALAASSPVQRGAARPWAGGYQRGTRAAVRGPPSMVSTSRWWTPSTSKPFHPKLRLRTDPPQGRSGLTLTLVRGSPDLVTRGHRESASAVEAIESSIAITISCRL